MCQHRDVGARLDRTRDMASTDKPTRQVGAARPTETLRSRPRRVFRRALRTSVLVFAGWLCWSLGTALLSPGTDSASARLAEWARGHDLGIVVVSLEKLQYRLDAPATGGKPAPGLLASLARTHSAYHPAAGAHGTAVNPDRVAMRRPLQPIDTPALHGEGVWRSLVTVHGQPAVQAAFERPDATHTSYLSGVVWMSSRLLRFQLHPGYDEPGGSWPVPDWIPPGDRRGLAATWNGAFRLDDAHGGFYLDGKTAGSLVTGAASEVFYRDGTMTVGSWNREVSMTPDVVGVRQNLGLLIDHGKVARNVNANQQFNWGATIGGAYYVFRSGVGVTAQGDVVYVSGDALSAHTLARLLRRAGCVRAMELDINPAWVSFMSYHAGHTPGDPTPDALLPDYERPANRYYEHTSRDFVAAYAR
jgi:hypothetical protein